MIWAACLVFGLPVLGLLVLKLNRHVDASIDRHVAIALKDPDPFDEWVNQAIDLTRDIASRR